MKCGICGEEQDDLIRFYWGFFRTEYEPEKWIYACTDCVRQFQRASSSSPRSKEELQKIEDKIIRRKKYGKSKSNNK